MRSLMIFPLLLIGSLCVFAVAQPSTDSSMPTYDWLSPGYTYTYWYGYPSYYYGTYPSYYYSWYPSYYYQYRYPTYWRYYYDTSYSYNYWDPWWTANVYGTPYYGYPWSYY